MVKQNGTHLAHLANIWPYNVRSQLLDSLFYSQDSLRQVPEPNGVAIRLGSVRELLSILYLPKKKITATSSSSRSAPALRECPKPFQPPPRFPRGSGPQVVDIDEALGSLSKHLTSVEAFAPPLKKPSNSLFEGSNSLVVPGKVR